MRSGVLASLVVLSSCVPSNVVATADREVKLDARAVAWAPATSAALDGLFASDEIIGAAAASVLKLFYLFRPDGSFTGAALLAGPGQPEFHVLSGRWVFEADRLVLGQGAEPATFDAAPGLLRLRGSDGTVILRRVELR